MAILYQLIICASLLLYSPESNIDKDAKRASLSVKISQLEMDVDLLNYAIANSGDAGKKYLPPKLISKQLLLTEAKKELEDL